VPCTASFAKFSLIGRYLSKSLGTTHVPVQKFALQIFCRHLYQYICYCQYFSLVPLDPRELCERGCTSVEGFSQPVLKDNCAVARGNQTIHHGNATSPGVYVLITDARCVKLCCLAQCSIPCIPISKQPRQVSQTRFHYPVGNIVLSCSFNK